MTPRTPMAYRKQLAALRRRVIDLEARLGIKPAPVVGRGGRVESLHHRCGLCGAEAGARCQTPNNYDTDPHHVRGREVPCGRKSCAQCMEFFDGERAEAAE